MDRRAPKCPRNVTKFCKSFLRTHFLSVDCLSLVFEEVFHELVKIVVDAKISFDINSCNKVADVEIRRHVKLLGVRINRLASFRPNKDPGLQGNKCRVISKEISVLVNFNHSETD